MSPVLHLNDLQCFVVAYELGSFSRAAESMNTVQSQISVRIQRLERFAGAPLFARLPHGIRPNQAGDLFYRHARRILSEVAELAIAVRARHPAAPPELPATRTRNQQLLGLSAEGDWIGSARSMWFFAEHGG